MNTKSKIFTLTILILSILTGPQLLAQNGHMVRSKLNRLQFVGNNRIKQKELRSWFRFRKGDLVSEQDVRRGSSEVLQRYADRGYYFAKFNEVLFDYNRDSSQVDVTLKIEEGDLLRVNKLIVEGLAETDKEILNGLETRSGKVFYQQTLQDDIDYLIKYYEGRGYPYCQVKIAEIENKNQDSEGEPRIDIRLFVEPGPEVTIDDIEIQGNEQTKDFVIIREIGFDKGELYDQRKIDKVKSKLMKLGYFKWVNPPRLEMQKDGAARLIIELEEGGNNRLDGVLGYNPSTPTSPGFVTGLLDISFGNLIGTGRQIEAHWERKTQKTQELRFRYLEPWVAGLPLHAGLYLEQLIQDTSYVKRSLGLDLRVQFNENLSFFSQISKLDITPDSLGAVLFGILPSNSINLGIGLTYDTLDDLINPMKGLRYQTSFVLGKKSVKSNTFGETGSESFEQKRISIDFETYFSIFRWQVLAFGFHGRQITSDEDVVQITDQYRFGGTRTLRGYREEQFRGSRIAWANLEYRYLLGRRSRLFAFLDTGYFFREALEKVDDGLLKRIKIEDAKIGYGIGLRIDTKLGFFGIDYGLGEGDSLSNGKVHVSLINEF